MALLCGQQTCGSRPLLVVERAFEATLLITAGEIADGLPRQVDGLGGLRRADAIGQPQQSQHALHDSNLLHTALESFFSSA